MRFALTLAIAACAAASHAQSLALAPFVSGLSGALAVIQDPLDPGVQFVVQQGGTIRVVQNGNVLQTPFMTLTVVTGSERGLLGMAFAPDHAQTGHFYLHFTTTGVYMQLARFTRVGAALTADPATRYDIFRTLRPFSNHNAGTIVFGPDQLLYVPTGDGGDAGDPGNRAQNPNELLGKMVRIDPTVDDFPGDATKNYGIPPSNPFLPANNPPVPALPEIWAFGLRNPWKVSFDRPEWLGTGALTMADVGQSTREEVDYEPAGAGGRNYGWKRFEGTFLYSSTTPLAYGPHTPPIHELDRTLARSITGGQVYRGLQLGAEFFGRYVFADYILARLYSLRLDIDPVTGEATASDRQDHTTQLGGSSAVGNVTTIDVDTDGELFVTSGGNVRRLVRNETTWPKSANPVFGPLVGGQVRSLVLEDGRVYDVRPIRPNLVSPRRGGVQCVFETNRTTRNSLDLEAKGRVAVPVVANVFLQARNWASGQFETVATGTWNVNQGTIGATGLDGSTYISPAGEVDSRVYVEYSGILPNTNFRVFVDQYRASVQ